ncbi:MAG: SCP2 sterol-binding domain-containing protein [Clostridia bacterium]
MTFLEKFEEIKKFADVQVDFNSDFAIEINMTDPDCGGTFYVEHKGGVLKCEPYDYNDRSARLIIKSDVLIKLLEGSIDPVASFLTGKFKIEGSVDSVLELMKLCEANKAKKKEEKKAEKATAKAEKKIKK